MQGQKKGKFDRWDLKVVAPMSLQPRAIMIVFLRLPSKANSVWVDKKSGTDCEFRSSEANPLTKDDLVGSMLFDITQAYDRNV
jgi:hypothetical protein